ncbi:hypothetical protein HYT02_04345 [Candidatus Gottesmanbacteria bacterium]|nr:hypothetical protein [Candidatus Gottesmanbacteria bacterium]
MRIAVVVHPNSRHQKVEKDLPRTQNALVVRPVMNGILTRRENSKCPERKLGVRGLLGTLHIYVNKPPYIYIDLVFS